MAFDIGFNFRSTSGYVTDPAYGVPVLGETYPHTYTNTNGYSINAGWDAINVANRDSGNDARLAGINYVVNTTQIFTVDLSSGSAPGAGDYTIDCAVGDGAAANDQQFKIKDTTTILIGDDTNRPTAADNYIDATLTNVAATTTWTGTPVAKTFATTTCLFVSNPNAASVATTLAHFRLTLATVAAAQVPYSPWTQRGPILAH